MQIENQGVDHPLLSEKKISLYIKREDLVHHYISGNKYRKLKYNLIEAKTKVFTKLLTFGGAYSNHIAATAYAGKQYGFDTIGVIRGDELSEKWKENPTLQLAHEHGMRFKFVSRESYRKRGSQDFIGRLKEEFGPFYLLPEGGTNALAIKGCEEILVPEDVEFDVVCCSVGTGGTIAGIINSTHSKQRVLGFSALKGDFLNEDIRKFAQKENWTLQTEYHFGGYAKLNAGLIHFINDFKEKTQIPLDSIYTGKMVYGIFDLVKKDYFLPNTKILAIHTGGLQSVEGMNIKLKKRQLPLIDI
ncbi:MAG: 1-aminocyclopropane-1-carboxylate deaminase [Maribacter sp.]|nr:MAG: 1-aminocyclopropane-1-carboxylate deaminase [Maribacter sp.]